MNNEIIMLPFLLLILKNEKKIDNSKEKALKAKDSVKSNDNVKTPPPNIAFDETKAYKLRDIASGIMTFLPEREKAYCNLYINEMNMYDSLKELDVVEKGANDKIESIDIREDRLNKINMLKALKPYLAEDKQKTLDFTLSLSEFMDELMSNWQAYAEKLKEIMKDKSTSIFEKLSNLINMFKPMLKDNINVDKISKQIKMMDLVIKAEDMMNDNTSKDKNDGTDNDQNKFVNNIKTLLNSDQQKALEKIMEMLSSGTKNKDTAKAAGSDKKEIIAVKPDNIEDAK